MDVRGKLVELIHNARMNALWHNAPNPSEYITDMLMEDGVTVQECGEWEEIEDDWSMETIYKCSACKEEFVTIDGTPADNLWNYCPHCGAKMMPNRRKENDYG